MALTITWDDGESVPEVWKVSPDALVALEAYRLTMTTIQPVDVSVGEETRTLYGPVPTYKTVKEMIVGTFINMVVRPALEAAPPEPLAALKAEITAKQAAYEQARAAVILEVLG